MEISSLSVGDADVELADRVALERLLCFFDYSRGSVRVIELVENPSQPKCSVLSSGEPVRGSGVADDFPDAKYQLGIGIGGAGATLRYIAGMLGQE